MIKQIGAGLFLMVLIGVVVFNVFSEDQGESSEGEVVEYNVTGDSSQEGTSITPPNAPDGLEVGEKAPDFTLETLAGETLSLSDLRGQKVILNFWATWCPPCREEMPRMEKFQQEYGDEIQIVAVNATGSESSIKKVRNYIEEGGYTFPVVLDKELNVNNDYQAIALPTTYFIGTDGVIQQPRKVGPMTYDFMVKMKNALN
ncbi:TlpA disulfide reductase family protein [Halobacillus amylolyticus]|uniref:TlpA family protein disulfide reductase n=1 Tax=Halobacillus amylolyticus TaxID=2932259 RepID=A0ABY4HDA8_9BACI|nr:TlpA disulfide reductase family protein [Halobacillus amylolyticus]UOR12604.1 TlpA family protein disulfide reductase [Halobacillus amylolyticus]